MGEGIQLINSEKVKTEIPIEKVWNLYNQVGKEILKSDMSFSKILTGVKNTSDDRVIKNKLIYILEVLANLDGQIYVAPNRGSRSFHRVRDSVPNKSIVCFDATSNVSETYKLRAEHHNDLVLIDKVHNVRNYDNLTICIASSRTGKNAFNNMDITRGIYDSIVFGEKTLIVTHKSNEGYFKEALPEGVEADITHWGALTGLNKWQDFDTIVIAGLNNKPQHFTQSRSIINTSEEVAFGELQKSINERIKNTDLISEIIQAINRIRVRKTIDEEGRCQEAKVYLILPILNVEEYKRVIKSNMPNAEIVDWYFKSSITEREAKTTHFSSIIAYLDGNLNVADEVNIFDPRNKLDIPRESYRDTIKKKDFNDRLQIFGYEVLDKREHDKFNRLKKRPVRYIRRFE